MRGDLPIHDGDEIVSIHRLLAPVSDGLPQQITLDIPDQRRRRTRHGRRSGSGAPPRCGRGSPAASQSGSFQKSRKSRR